MKALVSCKGLLKAVKSGRISFPALSHAGDTGSIPVGYPKKIPIALTGLKRVPHSTQPASPILINLIQSELER